MNANHFKIGIVLILIAFLIPSSLIAQEMIINIEEPVATEFGTYYPYPVNITPSCSICVVEPDFKNVINFNDFIFTAKEESLLAANHFVVSPRRYEGGTGYREIYDIYNECRDRNIPIFITSDAMLHTFHLCFDYILMTIEEQKFIEDLNHLLTNLINTTYDQFNSATEAVVLEALTRNLDFLVTAKILLDSTYKPPSYEGKYPEELVLINAHEDFFPSPIFSYYEDYTQYIVRGHYTKTIPLSHYFRSMMWLGRMTFAADPEFGLNEPNRSATRSAILLIQAIQNTKINNNPAIDIWEQLYTPTVFFVGKTDDINIYQYAPIIKQIYGEEFSHLPVDSLANEKLLDAFLTEATQVPGPKIKYPFQPQGFRFMGQRFIPDSYIFSELTYDRINSPRYFPKGLDAMVVLGSARALEILDEMGELAAFPDYAIRLNQLCQEFKTYEDKIWAQNIYWNWLYSLMPLLFPKGMGYPMFMQKPAWMDKELYAALSSWAELRHDTILYAKQSGSFTGITPSAVQQQGYVEPNPYLYARLASLAQFLASGLDQFGLLFAQFESHLSEFLNLSLDLRTISEKELTHQPLNSDEYCLINDIGKTIEKIVEFEQEYEINGPSPESDDEMPVIADVHTVTGVGPTTCLEEGVGYPYCIYVICQIENQIKVTKGACYSYYEFTQLANNRLTDETWRELLKTDNAPATPDWATSFLDGNDTWLNNYPHFHYWKTFHTFSLNVSVAPDSPKVGDIVEISIAPRDYWSAFQVETLTIEAVVSNNQKYSITDIHQHENHYVASWNTTGVPAGDVWLELSAIYVDETTYPIQYRTGFYLQRVLTVKDEIMAPVPNKLVLAQNYPNPFNSSTIISYSLPRSSTVSISIYNMAGEKVNTLVCKHQGAGRYTVIWNGEDDLGKQVASGVYFYKIKTENLTQIKKMILLF